MKTFSLGALAAAGLMAAGLTSGANAADLGGNCCADLEERVAELEATTARKGNRKVSLTISGWVAEQVTYWDDGFDSDVYVGGIGSTLGSNVKFTGQATIVPGWTAGYVLHLELDGSDTLVGTNVGNDNGPGLFTGAPGNSNYVQALQSYWFIKSDHYGKVGIGLQSAASDNTAILVDGSGSLVSANWVAFNVGGFQFRDSAGGLTGPLLLTAGSCIPGDCYGVPTNSVRYDSPTFAGFSVSATWGEDDFWDIAARYSGEHAGFKLAFAAAYAESDESNGSSIDFGDTQSFQAGIYVQHIASGLFALVNYGNQQDDGAGDGNALIDDGQTWYVKGGVRGKWNPLGATVLYGEWLQSTTENNNDDDFQWWGLGAVQEVDAAAMSLWLRYRNYSFDNNTATDFENFDEFTVGGLINF